MCVCIGVCVSICVYVCLCVCVFVCFIFSCLCLGLCCVLASIALSTPAYGRPPLPPLTSHSPPAPLHTALLSRCYPLDRNMLNLCCALLLLFIILTHFPYLLHLPLCSSFHSPLLMDYSIALHSAPVAVVVVMSVAQFVCIYHSHSGSVCVDGD